LAGVLENLGEYESAKEGFRKALATIKRILGEDNFEYA
jgi:tetratricopeptide (TPR) repeat protein